MNQNIIFQDSSAGPWVSAIFFIILTLFLPLGLSILSPAVRDWMEFKRKEKVFINVLILYLVIGVIGIICVLWQKNKIDSIELKPDKKLALIGFFGNKIAEINTSEITSIKAIPTEHSYGGLTYEVEIFRKGEEFYTNALNSDEAYQLEKKIKKLMGKNKVTPW